MAETKIRAVQVVGWSAGVLGTDTGADIGEERKDGKRKKMKGWKDVEVVCIQYRSSMLIWDDIKLLYDDHDMH